MRRVLVMLLATGLVVPAACASSQRVRQVPGETLPPLPPTVSARRRATTTSSTVVVTYVVKAGDTLDVIAARLHVDLAALVALNGIVDANKIQEGQVLQVPPTGSGPTTTTTSTTTTTTTTTSP